MKEENSNNDNNNDNNNSTCPPIELGMHQNSFKPENIEKRGSSKNE